MAKKKEEIVLVTYKGFDKNMQCRGLQYEVGKSYEEKKAQACETGFHACEYALDVFSYYPPAENRFAIVEQSGQISRHDGDSKVASSKIKISAELNLAGLVKAAVEYTISRCKPAEKDTPAYATEEKTIATNTGNQSAATNTGYRSAATNTGYRSAATNTGDYSAATNTGDRSAATNTGDYSAATNTGNQSAAEVTGKNSVALSSGYRGKAKAAEGCAIFLVYRNDDYEILHAKGAIAGKDGIKPDVWYSLDESGAFIEANHG